MTWISERMKGNKGNAFPLVQFLTALFFALATSAVVVYVFFHDTYWATTVAYTNWLSSALLQTGQPEPLK